MWIKVFFCDLREKGWKIVVKKEPRKKQVTDKIQIDFIEFDMFMLEIFDAYVCVQAPISIDESINSTSYDCRRYYNIFGYRCAQWKGN
jgi:hypothetical protein